MLVLCSCLVGTEFYAKTPVLFELSIKPPGNKSVTYRMQERDGRLITDQNLPVEVSYAASQEDDGESITVRITGKRQAYYHLRLTMPTGIRTEDSDFYLPGFWYHGNLRSPDKAPSFRTSMSWNFREDRLSSPLTSVYDNANKRGVGVLRNDDLSCDALTVANEGEVILSGSTSVGYSGFDNTGGNVSLCFGFPYEETPYRYIRKLTLAPSVVAFQKIDAGESISLSWKVLRTEASDFGDFVEKTWTKCFESLKPELPVARYSPEQMKAGLSNYFKTAFVNDYPLKFYSSTGININDCKLVREMQLGFCGRPLMNAFNSLEYSGSEDARAIFDSFLANGFSPAGYFIDFINYADAAQPAPDHVVHTIRQQSEGIVSVLRFLSYERQYGRRHPEWEHHLRRLLDNFVTLQNPDGSFPRKFRDDGSVVDDRKGSTPSATLPLVMGFRYFRNKDYLKAAERSVGFVSENIIGKSDYFSSTLDACCEDKEAAISAVSATYCISLISKGKQKAYYMDQCRKAAYFALSWYYLWDVPFAEGQMLGDLGFSTRGWGNVSVENNHVDVFAFELPEALDGLTEYYSENHFAYMASLMRASMCQLLPVAERMCGIGAHGFYPEVVQHTTWDYGRNGKGFYNDIFAPGWTTASLWEIYSDKRIENFLK